MFFLLFALLPEKKTDLSSPTCRAARGGKWTKRGIKKEALLYLYTYERKKKTTFKKKDKGETV